MGTTPIFNKYGIEGIDKKYNKHYKKRITKLSVISDSNGVPLDIFISSGNKYDNKIFEQQIIGNDTFLNSPSKKYLLADKAYDSNKIREYLQENGYIPIISYNRRNTKYAPIKKLNDAEKKILK